MDRVPTVASTIERHLLVNYRVRPSALERLLPAGFRPQLVNGVGVAGICLIRLGQLRPAGLPRTIGLTTEDSGTIAWRSSGTDLKGRAMASSFLAATRPRC